jgi:hypothetical protein
MPAATPLPLRLKVAALRRAGAAPAAIAARLALPPRTVRHLLACWRHDPEAGLAPRPRRGRPLAPGRPAQRQEALELRRLRPGWGAGRLRVELLKSHPPGAVAPGRTLQRWLRQQRLAGPPAAAAAAARAAEPHEVWQVDAVEGLTLKDGTHACWLRLTDECSGAILATEVFPLYRWAEVPARQAREALRRAFGRWGCPGALRTDNGVPWGAAGGLPSGLALWAAGLGVPVLRNPPRRPQRNGVVERSQGTSRRWAEPGSCADIAELRLRLEEEDRVQREVYPAVGGLSRLEAYPSLRRSGRGYCRGWEEMVWDAGEALRWLGRHRVRRKVSARGQVSLYHRAVEVGRAHGGCAVDVHLDAEAVEWVIEDTEGRELRRRPAPRLTPEAVMALEVARP